MKEGSSAGLLGAARVRRYVGERLSSMHPAYFAMSMATGIVSIACHLLGLRDLSALLFWINVPAYALIWIAMIARAMAFPRAFLADWTSHQRGPGFFTSVAATCVLGSQFFLLRHSPAIAFGLWVFGLVLWVICTYTVFVALSIREDKPSLGEGINGGWLIAVVATQAICVLGCQVLPDRVANRDAALFFLTSFWLCGGMLYIWMISLIFYRYTFFRFSPGDLSPPYWINMGAMAISTLAGSLLIINAPDAPFLLSLLPFIKGFTIFYWATGTWWIPMLLLLGLWRHLYMRFPLRYDPLYWGAVFPLGMYAASTHTLTQAMQLHFLEALPELFLGAALLAWAAAFLGAVNQAFDASRSIWKAISQR